jgi:hypothetical protein
MNQSAFLYTEFQTKKNPECGIPGVSISRGSQGRDSRSTHVQYKGFSLYFQIKKEVNINDFLFYNC